MEVNGYLVLVYFTCFALIAGAAFAMMWGNIRSINKIMDQPPKPKNILKHPNQVKR